MGFEVPTTAYRLKFEQPELAGLEVMVEELPIDEFLKLTELFSLGSDPAKLAPHAGAVYEALAGALVEWNLTRKGEPVPATLAGITSCGFPFIQKIVDSWMASMTGPAEESDLGKDYGSGATSAPVPPLPMEPLSPAPPS